MLLDEDTTRRFMTLPKRVVRFGSRAGAGAGLLLLALGSPLVAAWKSAVAGMGASGKSPYCRKAV